MNNVNLQSFYGITGAPMIEAFIEYLKNQWNLPSKIAPVVAMLIAIAWNLLLGYFLLGGTLRDAVISGLVTGLITAGWHQVIS